MTNHYTEDIAECDYCGKEDNLQIDTDLCSWCYSLYADGQKAMASEVSSESYYKGKERAKADIVELLEAAVAGWKRPPSFNYRQAMTDLITQIKELNVRAIK